MDWQLRSRDRTGGSNPASTKRWVTHARHVETTAPHRAVGRTWAGDPVVAKQLDSRQITLDGSSGEGGGQILRTALSLSMLTGRAFRIVKIRANRSQPGLRAQHAKAVEAAAKLCNAEVSGGSIGSRELTFRPGPIRARDLKINIGTAGSTALILQTLHLPIALRAESGVRLTLVGGTFNLAAPSFPFLESTWKAHLAAIGMPIGLTMPASGYFPEGGGRVEAWIEPSKPKALVLENRGKLIRVRGVAETTNLGPEIAERMAERVRSELAGFDFDVRIETLGRPGTGTGASITLVAETTNAPPASFVGLGDRGKSAELVADEAIEEFLAYWQASGGAVDPHSADQLLLPLSFAEGRSVYSVTEVTEHLRTNVSTIQAFLDRSIRIEESTEGPGGRVIVG